MMYKVCIVFLLYMCLWSRSTHNRLSVNDGLMHLCQCSESLIDVVDAAASRGELCSSPVLNQQLSKFSHEVIDLLQHSPQCSLPFSRFIPTYHHHFGRQCRIANYGFTKLIELFDAIPHVVQVCVLKCVLTWRLIYRCFTSLLVKCVFIIRQMGCWSFTSCKQMMDCFHNLVDLCVLCKSQLPVYW